MHKVSTYKVIMNPWIYKLWNFICYLRLSKAERNAANRMYHWDYITYVHYKKEADRLEKIGRIRISTCNAPPLEDIKGVKFFSNFNFFMWRNNGRANNQYSHIPIDIDDDELVDEIKKTLNGTREREDDECFGERIMQEVEDIFKKHDEGKE